jgi:COP9 signalosome complex subunit 6
MATSQPQPPSLLSTQKSDSGLNIALHPLVLLTISDYITRYTLRNQTGPLVGALLGQQNGLEITIEHAFEVKMIDGSLDVDWFNARLQQSTLSFQSPPLSTY